MTKSDWLNDENRRSLRGLFQVFERFRELEGEMPIQQILVLTYVALNEGKTQRELQDALNMPSSTTSRNIAALSEVHRLGKPGLGLVTWVDHPTDRRSKLLQLTPKGRAFASKVVAAL